MANYIDIKLTPFCSVGFATKEWYEKWLGSENGEIEDRTRAEIARRAAVRYGSFDLPLEKREKIDCSDLLSPQLESEIREQMRKQYGKK